MNKEHDRSRKKILGNMVWKFMERISAQLITFIISIIVARILMPEDYGVIALVMVFITIANVFVTNGLGNSLIQKKDTDNLDFSSIFYINLIVGLLLYLVIYTLAPSIASFYEKNELIMYIRVLGIRIIIASVNSIQQAYVARTMQFKKFFMSTLAGTFFSGVVGVILAYCGYGAWALIIQYLLNTIIDTVFIWFTVKWRPELIFSWKRAKELAKYSWKLLCASLLDNIYNESRNLIIGRVYTAKDLAFYNRGNSFPKLIMINISNAISSVLFPVLSSLQDNMVKLRQKMRKSIRVYSYLVFPVMVGLYVVADPLIKILLTEKWSECAIFLKIACINYMTWSLQVPMQEAIKAIGRSDVFLKMEIVRKIFSVFLLVCIMKYGVLVVALSTIADNVFSLIIISIACSKYFHYSYIDQVKDFILPFLLSLVMGVIVSLFSLTISNEYFLIIIQILVGVLIYVIGIVIFNFKSFNNVLYEFKNMVKIRKI